MINFSTLTADEFIRLNGDLIPRQFLDLLDDAMREVDYMKERLEIEKRNVEIADEQAYFARELVLQIDAFAEENLSKAKKMAYDRIRENTQFET